VIAMQSISIRLSAVAVAALLSNTGVKVTATQSSVVAATPRPIATVPGSSHLASGSVHVETYQMDTARGPVRVADLSIALPRVRLRVVDVVSKLREAQGYRSYSLREVTDTLHPLAAVSGASGPRLSLPTALGLIVDSGQTTARLDSSNGFATGIFCVDRSGSVSIFYRDAYRDTQCVDAIQSGPILVDPGGKVSIKQDETETTAQEHLVVAVTLDRRLHVITTAKSHLYDLANFLVQRLKADSAIAFGTGSAHSAVYAADGEVRFTYGNAEGAIPTALVILRR
jgi:uncharacterized protein YigE (DUF2233 family)